LNQRVRLATHTFGRALVELLLEIGDELLGIG